MADRLTAPQQRALDTMTHEWRSAYDLRVSLVTLDALVRRGLAERRGWGRTGAMYSPGTILEYRLPLAPPRGA